MCIRLKSKQVSCAGSWTTCMWWCHGACALQGYIDWQYFSNRVSELTYMYISKRISYLPLAMMHWHIPFQPAARHLTFGSLAGNWLFSFTLTDVHIGVFCRLNLERQVHGQHGQWLAMDNSFIGIQVVSWELYNYNNYKQAHAHQ